MSDRDAVLLWLESLKGAPAEVITRALGAMKELVESGGYGAVAVNIVAGKPKQVRLEQTYQGNG